MSKKSRVKTRTGRGKGLRLGLAGVSGALIASGAFVMADGSTARAATPAGQGNASAQAIQVTPHEGSLAVGAIFGEALAGNTGNYARAQSQGLDLGAVGTSMKSYNCGQAPQPAVAAAVPSPLEVETGQSGASDGVTDTNPQHTYGATEYGKANSVPYAEADTTYMPLNGGAAFVASGTHSKAWSGLVNGVQDAGAQVDISSLSLGNGAVVLDGLHWRVDYPIQGQPSGSFAIGHATVGGKSVPTTDLTTLASAINTVLTPMGMQFQLPQKSNVQGLETVSPLELQIVPNPTRDTVVDGVLNATAPAYNTAADGLESGFGSWEPSQLEQALCQSDTPITVAAVTLASINGAGFFTAAFGGVNSTASALPANSFNLGFGTFSLGSPGSSQFVPGSAAVPSTPSGAGLTAGSAGAVPASSASSPPAAPSPSSPGSQPSAGRSSQQSMSPAAASVGFASGGPLLALGLGGLAALLALAEADRRMIKHNHIRKAFEE